MKVAESSPRFIADVMLGRLARWLRALGYDTLYSSSMEDAGLARRALAEDRILLTRDVELTRRRGLKTILIIDDEVTRQLRQVVRAQHLSTQAAFTRCINCNTPLAECERAEAERYVPPYVLATQTRFRCCANCGRIYWRGTHWARMRAALDTAESEEHADPTPQADA